MQKTFGNVRKRGPVTETSISIIEVPTNHSTTTDELEESVDDVESYLIDPVTGNVVWKN